MSDEMDIVSDDKSFQIEGTLIKKDALKESVLANGMSKWGGDERRDELRWVTYGEKIVEGIKDWLRRIRLQTQFKVLSSNR